MQVQALEGGEERQNEKEKKTEKLKMQIHIPQPDRAIASRRHELERRLEKPFCADCRIGDAGDLAA